ncbi:YqjF family protein [Streptomyces sp. A1136]|uniref:YqjF family protein n=1 Tax=Streptomyces sp. A1136 TaxID=2563102 RepID=UPI00109EDD54|nr:DUF2071 domain-containing protein [Streptomyces sp. A1136]THA50161.1 DUF2071 domain-containing protein [Streptomyces sp. A1136]
MDGVPSHCDRRRVSAPLLTVYWRQQTMLHWRYPARAVQPLLPQGLVVDEFDGSAWVSLTPLVMACAQGLGLVPLPRHTFLETNLRTYVRLDNGDSGLWFFSLDVTTPLMLTARAVGVPYQLADLSFTTDGVDRRHTGRRRHGDATYELTVRQGGFIDQAPLDKWLTCRWAAYTHHAGRLWQTRVQHEPWRFRRGAILTMKQSLTHAAGLEPPQTEPLVHTSPGVGPVRIGWPHPVTGPKGA